MSHGLGGPVGWHEAPERNLSPRRLQLFRGAKFDLQSISRAANGLAAIRIDHNSGWENPFLGAAPTVARDRFRRWLEGGMPPDEMASYDGRGRRAYGLWLARRRCVLLQAMPALQDKNLACWCGARDPCHGDVLLAFASGV
jgi:hypothetical protein